jgi:large subunit ribosomal protein L2
MAIKSFRPLTPAGRFTSLNKVVVSKKRPERNLTEPKPKTGGRNVYGRITSRHRGGGHKQLYRIIDFKRDLLDLPARVQAIEYDPNRTAHLALFAYASGEKRYIIAPQGLKVGRYGCHLEQGHHERFQRGQQLPAGNHPSVHAPALR